MATVQQREQAREEVRASLQKVLAYKKEDLVRTHDLGVQSDFSGGAEAFNQLLQLYDDLSGCKLELLSYDHLQQVKGVTASAVTMLQAVLNYQAASGPGTRDTLIQQAR